MVTAHDGTAARPAKRFYCTYFDRNYLSRGLALIGSLFEQSRGDWQLFVVCMDEEACNILERLALPNVSAVSIEQIEHDDPALATAKNDRSRVEYLWTTTPAIILWLLMRHPEIDLLTYLDADLFFYSSPEPLFEELNGRSVLIHEHRYTPELRDMEINGKYNVGLVSFRADEQGKTALRWWRERCIESCHLDIKSGKCGDQMYLNDWPERFAGVHVLQHPGAGVAPWNVDQFSVTERDRQLFIDGAPLIFYHFHSLRIVGPESFRPAYRFYIRRDVRDLIYRPYMRALSTAMREIERIDPAFRFTFKQPGLVEKSWDLLFSSRTASRLISTARQTLRRLSAPRPSTSS